MKFKILILLAVIASALSAPETITKKCYESSFCGRCRSVTGTSPYVVQVNSLESNINGMKVDVKNVPANVTLVLKLDCLATNTFHFEIDEKNPSKERFRVTQVITSPLEKISAVTTTNNGNITVSCGNNRAIIQTTPFKIDFYQGDVLAVTINNKHLMRFEHLREKSSMTIEDDVDSWEETWEGYTDSKPNGPEAVAMDFTFPSSDLLFGIPEHQDTFALRRSVYGEPYRLYTTDVTFYDLNSMMPNYGAIPVIYGHGEGRTAGIFWHNSADTYIDIHDGKTSHFMSEGGIIDVFVLLGPSPNEAFSQYTKLTGIGNLPPLSTLAYHQCRWSYYTQAEVLDIVAKFDENNIPLDTMWLDIDYTDGKRYFTWNYTAFPNPLEMIGKLKESGRHLVHIIDPHIKFDPDYFFYRQNRDLGYFIKEKDGLTDYVGNCWPGDSTYVDFFNPNALKFYADQYLLTNFNESSVEAGIWNDMNEPVIFNAPEKTFPRDAMHFDGRKNWEHRYLHNMYGMMQTSGTFDGMMRRGDGKYRPFILTRAFFAGTQKYSAVWTGDNIADWGYLLASVQTCLAISVAGISFCGSDIGGFFGEPDDELFVRWNQAAAFQPFFRNHASQGTRYREPYRFSERVKDLATAAIRTRYEFLPMWYTLFYEHELTGVPVMRPMLSEYPRDKKVFKLDTQYMLGDKLLVRPVVSPGETWVIVQFPSTDGDKAGEIWYDIHDYQKYDVVGTHPIQLIDEKIPVFQRGGTVIPKKLTPRSSSVNMRDDPYTLYIAVDKNEFAHGTLYVDDETSYDYRDGAFHYFTFHFEKNSLSVSVNQQTKFTTKSKFARVYIAGLKEQPKSATQSCTVGGNSRNLEIHREKDDFFHIDVNDNQMDCEFAWNLTLNGAKTATMSGLLMLISIYHIIKNFFI